MIMNILNALIKARNKIDKPSKWISYWCISDDGKRYGADGALWWAITGYTYLAPLRATKRQQKLYSDCMTILANQTNINPMWKAEDRVCYLGKHKEVMDMFDKAITHSHTPAGSKAEGNEEIKNVHLY